MVFKWYAIWRLLLCAGLVLSRVPCVWAAGDPLKGSTVFVQVGYVENDVFHPVEEGSGFIVNPAGWVVTSKHVVNPANFPAGKQRIIYGAVSSRTADKHELFEVPTPVVSADAALLRFSPDLPQTWTYLKILANHQFSTSDKLTALGFPFGKEIEVRPGSVTNLLGQNGLIGVNPGLAPGMSGGPVVLDSTRCVIGIVAGGTGYPNFDYIVPTQLLKPLLEVPPAEFVTTIVSTKAGSSSAATALFDRSYRVEQGKDDHQVDVSSQYYSFPFRADAGAKIVSARLVEESVNFASDKTLNIAGDGSEAVFRFKLQSGPLYDRWRGWWNGQVVLTERYATPPKQDAGTECD